MLNLIGEFYNWVYNRVGGKPWTEIVREDQKKSPLLYLLIFLFLGIMVGKLAGKYWWHILVVVVCFGLGILAGHFWW